jgi:hypothetical protein
MQDDEFRIPPPGYRSSAERRAEDMKRMTYLGGAIGVVLLLCIIGYAVVSGGGSDAIPTIQPPATPLKVKPENPGGLAITTPTGGLLGGNGGQNVSLAPAPEVPDPAALAAEAKQEQPAVKAPQTVAAAAAPPAGAMLVAPSASATPTSPSRAAAGAAAAAMAAPVSIPTVPEKPAAAGPKQVAMTAPAPSRETARVHNLAGEYRPPPPSQTGRVKVQLAALNSKEAAQSAWEHLSRRMPGLFAGRRPIFMEAQVNGRTYWRLRLAGFASIAEARAFCQDVHAHGGACTVAAF